MSLCVLRVNGYISSAPGDKDPIIWDVRGPTPEDAFLLLAERLCPYLKNLLPFVVKGSELISLLRIEVLICD